MAPRRRCSVRNPQEAVPGEHPLPRNSCYPAIQLADGSVEHLPVHRVGVSWHGQTRAVRAYGALTDEALTGISLLRGSRPTVDSVPGGAVLIEEL